MRNSLQRLTATICTLLYKTIRNSDTETGVTAFLTTIFFTFANGKIQTFRKTWGMLTENLALKSLNELKDILGERLTQEKYDSLKVGWNRAKKNTK